MQQKNYEMRIEKCNICAFDIQGKNLKPQMNHQCTGPLHNAYSEFLLKRSTEWCFAWVMLALK